MYALSSEYVIYQKSELKQISIPQSEQTLDIGKQLEATFMEEISDRKEYVKATMQADGVVILEGTATWCPQCKAIAPFVDQVGTLT